jgi:hypothetical protein
MGIILLFLIAGALFASLVTLAVAGSLTLISLYLTHNHHPAWRWPGAIVLTIYAGALLWKYWKSSWSSDGVPEGLRKLWSQVGAVVVLWPLPAAIVALLGAALVVFFPG